MDSQLTSNILMGFIGILSIGAVLGTVGAFWSMGRQAYRKD